MLLWFYACAALVGAINYDDDDDYAANGEPHVNSLRSITGSNCYDFFIYVPFFAN